MGKSNTEGCPTIHSPPLPPLNKRILSKELKVRHTREDLDITTVPLWHIAYITYRDTFKFKFLSKEVRHRLQS
jgi:hypothetical protein